MSTIDEVLATAEVVDAVCVIDGETRIISVPTEYKELGVESDEKVTRVKFQCPKIVGDNIDLTEYNLYINYRNAGNKLNSYLVEDVTVTGDTINFSWLLSRHVTESPGTISYIVCAKKSDDTGVINEWNTKVATGIVGIGLEATEEIEEQNIDAIEQILRSIVELENKVGGGGSGEAGGYYAPAVDAAGNLSWMASKADMPAVDGANIKGPQGETGAKGDTGSKGDKGDKGADGKSAYAYAVEGGYTGTEAEFAAKLAQEKQIGVSELYPFCRKFNQIAYSYVAGGGGTNSKEHFLHCAQSNYDSIKTDLRLTSDGALVCCHDEGFTFNSDGRITAFDSSNCTLIHEMTYAEVMALEFNMMYNGSRCHTSDLDYVLQVCKAYGKLAYITIRGEYIETTAELVVSALKKWGMLGNCIINSFSNDALMAVRAIAPEVYLSFVFVPYTESERTFALTNANANERYMLCLYYSSGHTVSDLTGDSGVLDFIRQCQSNGIILYGAKEELDTVGDADALLSLGFGGVQTKLARPAPSGDLDISEMSMSVSVENTSNVLTISDGIGNSKTVTLPDASLTDEQADSAISKWMEKNAATKTFSSKNVYNPNDVNVADGYLAAAGQVNSSADYWTTGFIPASPGDVVTPSKDGVKCNFYFRAAYDSSKTFISRESGNTQTYTIPDGASYFRVSFKNAVALKTDNVMLTINNSDLTYEAYFEPYEQSGISDYFILVSPSGTKYKLSVSDNGTISTVAV